MAVMTETRWLDPVEMRAWRNFIDLIGEIMVSLDDDLRDDDITLGDYEVLVFLSEAPGQRLRM